MTPPKINTFVTLGEGLAAGVGHFSLSDDVQAYSFPSLVAERLGVKFSQPLIEPPGVGNVGFAEQPVIVPELLQTTVLREFPRKGADLDNLSVPGLSLSDALTRRPCSPLVQPDDANQTLLNLILGIPGLTMEEGELPTQVEYAVSRNPDLVLVALGYQELLESLVEGHRHGGGRTKMSGFGSDFEQLLDQLVANGRKIIVCTVPNPLDTAYFSDLKTAAHVLRTEETFLRKQFGLAEDDLIDLRGLTELGFEFTARQLSGEVIEGSVISAEEAALIEKGLAALNRSIRDAAEKRGAVVFDLHGYLAKVARDGAQAGDQELSGDFLGGFYLLNGVYPGRTGHALIANQLIDLLNLEFESNLEHLDVAAIAANDANTLSKIAEGPTYTEEYLKPRTVDEVPPPPPGDPSMINVYPPFVPGKLNIIPIQTTYVDPPFDIGGSKARNCCVPKRGVPAGGLSNPHLEKPLELPPGLEQNLSINKELSYFGDALRPVDAPDEEPFLPGLPTFGASGNTFFGGLAMTDSHLAGSIRIRFSEPDENNECRFEITHPGGLVGDDAVLTAPKFFKLPNQCNRVTDVAGLLSTGQLNLDTGVVTDFNYNTQFINTATATLGGVNPNLPGIPIMFPGAPNGGSTWARFDQRDDGLLDITLAGNTFLPLGLEFDGDPIRFPLPFGNPKLQCASIVARGTVLHPHIHLSTRKSSKSSLTEDQVPEIPVNSVVEFSPFVRKTNFGDIFGLKIDEMGGDGTGRSHLMGRLRIQFGARSGDTVSMALSFLPPGGLLSEEPKPLPYLPPGTPRGMVGFNEQLIFPKGVTYNQKNLSSAMDPNNLAICAVNVKTGEILDELLCRSFVVQKLFVNLIDVEPCTPGDSFLYQGPARFTRGHDGELVFALNGEVFIPYPKGFKFPAPTEDGRPAFDVVGDSVLDPFLRVLASNRPTKATGVIKTGGNAKGPTWKDDVSSIGQAFRYRLHANLEKSEVFFEYENKEDEGIFKLHHLSWVSATNSPHSTAAPGSTDTITFSGFGTWITNGNTEQHARGDQHQVAVQISTSKEEPYVGIMVNAGTTSNVNTKPPAIADSIPDLSQ